MSHELTLNQQIERSIMTTCRSRLWTPFVAAVKRYQLIAPGDRIAVCISGGKDSMLMGKLMQLLQRYSDWYAASVALLRRERLRSRVGVPYKPPTPVKKDVKEPVPLTSFLLISTAHPLSGESLGRVFRAPFS